MQRLRTILGLLLLLSITVVGYGLGRQFKALSETLDRIHVRQEQALQEHKEFLEAHERRMEYYEGLGTCLGPVLPAFCTPRRPSWGCGAAVPCSFR